MTVQECAELDRFTRKQMTLFKALHPHADIDRLYVNRKMGGRGLLSIADVVRLEKHSLSVYVNKSKEPIMTKVRDHLLPDLRKGVFHTHPIRHIQLGIIYVVNELGT